MGNLRDLKRDCAICSYAELHGSWPPDHRGTHCRSCHRSWWRKSEAHCGATPCCGAHFASVEAADLHLVFHDRGGTGAFRVMTRRLELVEAPSGPTWRRRRHPRQGGDDDSCYAAVSGSKAPGRRSGRRVGWWVHITVPWRSVNCPGRGPGGISSMDVLNAILLGVPEPIGWSEDVPESEPAACDEYGPENVDDYDGPPLSYSELMTAIEANRRTFTSEVGATSAVWVVDGRNIVVRVRNGCLEVTDGVHPHRRVRVLTRAEAGSQVKRVLVTGAGAVTTEAMTWCHLQGLPLVVARTGPVPTMIGAPILFDHGGLRRAQALSGADPGTAIRILCWLLDRRLADQAWVAGHLVGRPDKSDAIQLLRRHLTAAATVGEAMITEARAAERYWSCWEGPGCRSSLLTGRGWPSTGSATRGAVHRCYGAQPPTVTRPTRLMPS